MYLIRNCNVVLENGILWDGAILTEGDRIVSVGREEEIEAPAGAEAIDANGAYAGPGFVDIHVHGGGGYSFDAHPYEAAEHFLKHGETTIVCTLYYDLKPDGYIAAMERIRDAKARGGAGDALEGIYMEGPYMNPKYGADAHNDFWNGEILECDYAGVVDCAGELVKVWAVAPERDGIERFMEFAKKANPSVVFAFGHCEADERQIRRVKKYGIKLQTHCMNATGRVSDMIGVRGNGPDEVCMMDPDIYAELICDSCAVHVKAENQRFLVKTKGVDKIVLITDSTHTLVPSPEKYAHIKDLNYEENGGLSGSRLTLNLACKNIMTHTNCGIVQAFLMASRNPARAIGMDYEIGTVEEGKRANLVFVDDKFDVKRVMLNGEFVR